MRRWRRLAHAELVGALDRRLVWVLVLAIAVSMLGGLATGAVAVPFAGAASAAERLGLVISRGAASSLAVTAAAALLVASPYRDGTWLHAALAAPRPGVRALAAFTPMLALAPLCATVAVLASLAGAWIVGTEPAPVALILGGAHVGITLVWALWMTCVAHATRSPTLTLLLGLGMPLAIEPAIAGMLAGAGLVALRWALPATALRAVGELGADTGVILEPLATDAAVPIASVACWSVALVGAAAARLWARSPR